MPFPRASTLERLRTAPHVPVLIVGGGINGAGLLRELALQGIDALLVERGDFASGASAASSRMIHGGLRYLENGEFRLVREALRERNRLLKNAPHCVRPLATVIPLFSRWTGFGNAARKFLRLGGRPAQRGLRLVQMGLRMYETFAGAEQTLPRHRIEGGDEARRARPALHPEVIATATYFDAWNPLPERLCLEVLDDATRLHSGAAALNYCALTGPDPVRADAVQLRDALTGETFSIRPRVLVNATGAWIDATQRRIGSPTTWVGGTKGSHLVVDHPELFNQLGNSELFYENEDGRICIILPLHGRVLVGSTDIRIDDPDTARCEEDEIEYLLGAVRLVFPGFTVPRDRIIARFCGVRPLPPAARGNTGQISRDHAIRELAPDANRPFHTLALVGGKWTTFRAFAEVTCDRILALLGTSRRAHSHDIPIGGGRDFPHGASTQDLWNARVAARHGLDRGVVASLFDRHGTRAAGIAGHLAQAGRVAFTPFGPCLAGELDWIARHEAVVHLDDLLLRRTPLALFGHMNRASLVAVATIAGTALAWSDPQRDAEIARCIEVLTTHHGIDLDR